MPLSQSQLSMVERARAVGGGRQGFALSESACAYIAAIIASDLGLSANFPELPTQLPPFFGDASIEDMEIPGVPFLALLERLVELSPDADTYFASLAKLHKTRLKFERILRSQPIPTVDQVGPRALLEFGKLSPAALSAYLFWRKWLFDIDNRAAQETGYLFEPIIAAAIGGVPVSAQKSPVRRHADPQKGRQVDCVKGARAYELKLRVTTAASGQGRWSEELEFPRDCATSGFIPVLVVLDGTPNPKLAALQVAFEAEQGEVYIGTTAWRHLNDMAGPTMARFLDRYVHAPLQALLEEATPRLPDLHLKMQQQRIEIAVGAESFDIPRAAGEESLMGENESDTLPADVDEEVPGV